MTPRSAVRHASVDRHITDCAMRPGLSSQERNIIYMYAIACFISLVYCVPHSSSVGRALDWGSKGYLTPVVMFLELFSRDTFLLGHLSKNLTQNEPA